jgi:hypothetical protein
MAEAQAAPEQTPAASTSTTEAPKETQQTSPTLDDVYKTYKVDEMAQEFSAKPKQERQEPEQRKEEQAEINVPDPVLDLTAYRNFVARDAKEKAGLKQALNELRSQLTNQQRAALQQAEEADIRKAVSKVNDHLGDSKLPDDFVEVALGVEAKRDPRFFTLWNNRSKKPEAFDAAVKAFAGKLGKTYALRADPQIAENQRALREATSTKATTAPEPTTEERLGKLQGAEFQRAIQRIKQGQSPF